MRITANHAHIFPAARREDGTVEKLLNTMDDCGISECVAFATFHRMFADYTESTNRFLADSIKPYRDRLYGFGVIDFDKDDVAGQVHEIVDLGLKGIKMHPAYQHFNVMGEKAQTVYQEAEKNGLFISFHTGVHWDRIANYHPLLFDEVAYNYPRLRFSMEHIGGYSFFRDALAVLTNSSRSKECHVFGGLTSVFDKEDNAIWHLDESEILQAIKQAGAHALIFGIDFPYNDAARTQKDIAAMMELPISSSERELIMGGNLRSLLQIK